MSMIERPPLNRERVIAAALDLVDEGGVEALSMRKLGAALGVEAMSLYNHVSSKDDLLDGVADLLLRLVEVPPRVPGDWRTSITELCAAVRRMGLAHPRAFPLLVTQTRTSFDSWAPILEGFELARGAGLVDDEAVEAVNAMSAFLVGFILFEINALSRPCGASGHAFDVAAIPPDRPLLREYVTSRHPAGFDEEFLSGIALFLDGVEQRVQRRRATR